MRTRWESPVLASWTTPGGIPWHFGSGAGPALLVEVGDSVLKQRFTRAVSRGVDRRVARVAVWRDDHAIAPSG